MRNKRVAIIGTTGLPARYGGFETLAHHLVDGLNNRFDITVYCSSKYFAKIPSRPKTFNGAKLVYLPFNANGYQSIIYDMVSIIHALRKSDVLLLLGVSGAMILPFIKLFTNKPVLVNIDGQEWKRPKWNWITKRFLNLCERFAVKFADTVIADNKIIREYVEDVYNRKDSCLIEYGCNHVSKEAIPESTRALYSFLSKPYAFNVCRIEPENNVHVILEAFSKQPSHTLVIVGLWSHGKYGIGLKNRYSSFPNIHLLDPIYDQTSLNIIRSNASVYVHGHSAGGTNPSLVEAMGLGLPVIAYDVSYNRETTGHKAAYFNSAADLFDVLRDLDDEKRALMSDQLETLANERYTWNRITSLYAKAIEGEDSKVISITKRIKEKQLEIAVEERAGIA